jgi:CRISPR/Cas system-associated endonuclease Cas1
MQAERTRIYPPLEPREGVLVVDGYGVKVHCLRGHLVVSDGIGPERRTATFHRATSHLKRLVLLGHEGFVTLEAIRWLDDVGAALVHIGRDGRLLSTTATYGRDDPRLRRAQALAGGTETGLGIAIDLLTAKLEGQARVLDRLGVPEEPRATVTSALDSLGERRSPFELMATEAAAAIAYWAAWSYAEVPFVKADRDRVPEHWRTFGKRASPLTGNPRLASNPANALLNYLYAILEAECRIA